MEEKRLWELLGKKITGEADAGELEELSRLLERLPEALYTLETMEQYWRASKDKADSLQREAALERHLRRIAAVGGESGGEGESDGLAVKRKVLWRYIAGAAAAAAVFAGFLFLSPSLRKSGGAVIPVAQQLAVTTGTERRQLQLPDGSRVWLNAGTTLNYIQKPGTGSLREVTLSGEAYFEVKHDAKHPFVVHTQRMDIRDLGTSFNVKAYLLDRTAEATLVEGAIDVRLSKEKGGLVLNKRNQKLIVFERQEENGQEKNGVMVDSGRTGTDAGMMKGTAGSGASNGKTAGQAYQLSTAFTDPADSLLAETAWMKNMLVFRNEGFEQLALKLERWYGVGFRFTDKEVAGYRFTGVLADESLEQALQELQLMKSFHFTITNKMVVIKK